VEGSIARTSCVDAYGADGTREIAGVWGAEAAEGDQHNRASSGVPRMLILTVLSRPALSHSTKQQADMLGAEDPRKTAVDDHCGKNLQSS
jgi:hypothetical protein